MVGAEGFEVSSPVATLPFLLLDLRVSLFKCRGFRSSQACPSFSTLLPIDRIPQVIGITGITPLQTFLRKLRGRMCGFRQPCDPVRSRLQPWGKWTSHACEHLSALSFSQRSVFDAQTADVILGRSRTVRLMSVTTEMFHRSQATHLHHLHRGIVSSSVSLAFCYRCDFAV
jgi:hypothetical protein